MQSCNMLLVTHWERAWIVVARRWASVVLSDSPGKSRADNTLAELRFATGHMKCNGTKAYAIYYRDATFSDWTTTKLRHL